MPLTSKFKSALRLYIGDSERLELFLERNGFYTKRCSSHDHWRGGLLQHSWRVYQYMLFLREHPELLKGKTYADEVGRIPEKEVALVGLLHDVGKAVYSGSKYHGGHESRLEQIVSKFEAMETCNACVLVLPCGRSAHTEAGWFAGRGKKVIAYIPEQVEPELMYKLFTGGPQR